ncbi:MAG: XRE family transcriptional regulator [Deltaproteobacteria bacterium]|jgi:Zn-dependent peptidase ImmA (M78 family)/DNA-binding XRE family transcriptional regulator|nr:XRE family transcriptional regulator [Deltaproteobacteria bacterium]
MEKTVISVNIKRLRMAKHMTQMELAEAAGISRVALSNIEKGKVAPRVDTLEALSESLSIQLKDLVSPVRELHAVRFRALKRMRTRDQILAEVSRWLTDFSELEDILNDREPYELDKITARLKKLSPGVERAKIAANMVRDHFKLNPDEPIWDICGLLEKHGIKILPLSRASDSFFGLSIAGENGGPAIVVNTWDRISVERWIFSAAHELGHLLFHLDAFDANKKQEDREEEKEADLFASYFLMPSRAFLKEWKETFGKPFIDRVLKVKRIFRVSYKTVLYRLVQEKIVSPDIWKKFNNAYKQRFGKAFLRASEPKALAAKAFMAHAPESQASREPVSLSPTDFMENRLGRLVRRAIEAGEITMSRCAEILGLSLSEMRELTASWLAV